MSRTPDAEPLRLRQSASAMGSTFSIALYGHDRQQMEAAAHAAFEEVRRLERLLSTYRPDSECSLVNRRAVGQAVAVSPELFQLLSYCLEQSRLTDGAFDVTVAPLKRAWGFVRGPGRVPSAEERAAALAHVGSRFVQRSVVAGSGTVRFDHPGVEIDFGGVGKGYAVDRAVEVLRQHGVEDALVAGSSSSLYGLGAPPHEPRGWRADIRDPERPGTRVAEVFLRNAALTTSGTGGQCFLSEDEGRLYSHVVDPRTGWPLQSIVQASLVTPTALEGEVWAKACLLNGPDWTEAHLPRAFMVV